MFINGIGEGAAKTPIFLRSADCKAIDIGLSACEISGVRRNPGGTGKVVNHMRFSGVHRILRECIATHKTSIVGIDRCHTG